jgi:hypothetical protein
VVEYYYYFVGEMYAAKVVGKNGEIVGGSIVVDVLDLCAGLRRPSCCLIGEKLPSQISWFFIGGSIYVTAQNFEELEYAIVESG